MEKGLRVFGHPLHAILSDFPVALLGTSLLWDAVAVYRGESVWWSISFWSIALGLLMAMLAATAGAVDYAAIKEGDPALAVANKHMLCVLIGITPYVVSLLVRGGPGAPGSGRAVAAVFGLEALGALLLSLGGWYGGHLVFHHGIGRDDKTAETKS